jgi:hypothetical protein
LGLECKSNKLSWNKKMKPPKKEPLVCLAVLGEIHINPMLRGPHP